MIFDSHAHYDDERFDGRDALLTDLFAHGVCGIVNAGTNLKTCRISLDLADKYERMYACVGIHPSDCYKYEDIDSVLGEVKKMLSHPKAVALGECGLDYHYDFSPKDTQKIWFEAQLSLAESLGVPVIIHDRDAHADVIDMLLGHDVTAVIHSCSESAEDVTRLVKAGHYISFSGTVSFKNAVNVRRAAAAVPDDRLLVETDAPYLAPTPLRGTVNHSGNIIHTAAALAEARGCSTEDVLRITKENAHRLFGVE